MSEESVTARRVVSGLLNHRWTIATGESLTAGLVVATLAEVPGCSSVVRGGVVAYTPDAKASLLDVPGATLEAGLVTEAVARALAEGAARRFGAEVGVGTTGAAGPDSHDGAAPGTAWIGLSWPGGSTARLLQVSGDRNEVRRAVAQAALEELADMLELGPQ